VPAALALLSSLLWGTSDFLGGTASRRLPALSVLGGSQLVALLGLVPVAVLTGELDAPRGYLLPGVAAGLVGMAALSAFYRALAAGTMGVVAPVASLGVVVPIGVGLLRGEAPTALQLTGMAAAIVGVVLASGPELSGEGRHGGEGRQGGRGREAAGSLPLLLAGLAAVGFGVVLVLVALGSRAADPVIGGAGGSAAGGGGVGGSVVMVLLTMRLTSVLALSALLVGAAPRRGWSVGVARTDLPVLAAVGAGDVLANGCYALAARSSLVSVTAVLASLYPVVTALLAYRLHAERLRGVQVAGVAAALAGVALIAAG